MEIRTQNVVTIKYSEILFYLFFGFLLFAKGIGLYDGQPVFKAILVIATLCLIGKICLEKYNIKQIIFIGGLFLLGGLTYILSGEKGLLLNCMLIIGMHNMKSKRVYKVAGLVWGIAFGGIMVSSLFHMEDTVYKVHEKLGLGHIFRWSLGYSHPNVLQITYLLLAIIIVYLLGENFRLWHAVALFLGNCFFFLYSVSYTGFIVVTCLLVGRVYLLYRPKLCLIEKVILQLFFPGCIALSLLAPLFLTGKAFEILDKLMNTRLSLAKHFLTQDYIHLLGNRLSDIITESLTMDNSYVFAFITYGIIPFILIAFFTIYTIYRFVKREQCVEVLILIVIAIGGLTEPFLYNTSFKNLSFTFMGEFVFSEISGNEKYSIIAKYNKEKSVAVEFFEKNNLGIKAFLKCCRTKILFAAIGAVLVCILSNFIISYPEGYVVYRSDCSGLEKVFHYYGEETGYEEYREMEDFKQGELVEYFGGNIVVVEKVRNNIMALLLGFIVLYLIYGVCESAVSRRRRKA